MTPNEAVMKMEDATDDEMFVLSLAATGYTETEIFTILVNDQKDDYYRFIPWGPAGELVKRFLDAYADAGFAYDAGLTPNEPNIHETVAELWNDMRAAKSGRKLHAWIVMPAYCSRLSERLLVESGKALKNQATSEYGLWAICWMLTGQFLFSDEMVEEFQPFVSRVDDLLVYLNQPPLDGLFKV